jgi:hypothetical protein
MLWLKLLQEVLPEVENEATTTTTLVERLAEWSDQMEPILFWSFVCVEASPNL